MRKILVFLIAATLSAAANAVPIVAANGDIADLEVGGNTYDVNWVFGTVSPSAGDLALFNGDAAFANLFMQAVVDAFADAGFGGVSGQAYYGVDYAPNQGWIAYGSSFTLTNTTHGAWGSFADAGWGSVTQDVTAVPEPGMLTLMGLGLASLAAVRRRGQGARVAAVQ